MPRGPLLPLTGARLHPCGRSTLGTALLGGRLALKVLGWQLLHETRALRGTLLQIQPLHRSQAASAFRRAAPGPGVSLDTRPAVDR
jgi:hypothetical protein